MIVAVGFKEVCEGMGDGIGEIVGVTPITGIGVSDFTKAEVFLAEVACSRSTDVVVGGTGTCPAAVQAAKKSTRFRQVRMVQNILIASRLKYSSQPMFSLYVNEDL